MLEDGILVGSWYFSPTSATDFYVRNADGDAYVVETLYARFGHWLDVGTNADLTVTTYAMSAGTTNGLDFGTAGDLTGTEATYSGPAVGMSVVRTFDSEGTQTGVRSGAFQADAVLTATFGTAPMLEGTISGFTGAVNTGWEVTLDGTAIGGDGAITGATSTETGVAGAWEGQAYGVAGARPTGIFGGFDAHFSDGDVAGAYATRRQ